MIINIQQAQRGVINYVENEIAKKATGLTKFGVYFILPKLSNNTAKLINSLKDNMMFKDMFDENGNIELDSVYNGAKEAIKKSGQFEMYGIIFNESDIDKLYNYIKNTSV